MSAFGGLILTNKGRALQAKAQAGTQLNFTRIGIGDGSLTGQSITDLNTLISEKKSLAISKFKVQAVTNAVVGAVLSNADMATGFYFRELGVFAQDPDAGEILYCYGNAGNTADYIPAGGGSDIVEKTIDCVTIVGNAANVSATIDSSLAYASTADLQDHINDHNNPHQVTAAQIGAISTSQIGVANGVASLGADGKVLAAELPAMDYIPTTAEGAANGVATLGADQKLTPSEMPIASDTILGGVKVGSNLTVAADGTLSGPAPSDPYSLPIASANTLGGVKIGTGINEAGDGTISATASSLGAVDKTGDTMTGPLVVPNIGNANGQITSVEALLFAIDTRTTNFTFTNGKLTGVTVVDPTNANATVESFSLTYTNGQLTSVADTAGGHTATTTLNYTNGQLSSVTKSYA